MRDIDIVPLNKQGHFVIPITDKNYELCDSVIEVDLTQKDFEEYDNKWDGFFKNLNKSKLNYHDLSKLLFYLPKVLFMKVKKEKMIDVKEGDLLNVCGFMVYPKSKVFKNTTVAVILDHLRPIKKRWFNFWK